MRIVFSIILMFCGSLSATAQQALQNPQDIQKRSRGISEQPVAVGDLTVTRYASGLGNISAIVGHTDGSLYVSDQERGRVYHLSDRNKDGAPDLTRMIADGFSSPSGLAIVGPNLYVADAYAIWVLPLSGGDKNAFVSLANVKADIAPRPLLAMKRLKPGLSKASESLVLGLSQADGTGQLISVDVYSRRAENLAQSPKAVTTIARSGLSLWIGTETGIIPVNGDQIELSNAYEIGAAVRGMVLPGQFSEIHEALETHKDHVLVSLDHAPRLGTLTKGSYVAAVPTQFGNTQGRPQNFVSGFISNGGRTGWGRPGPMWMDARGVFLSDSWSGTVWRIFGEKLELEENKSEPESVETPEVDISKPKSTALPLVEGIEQTPASMLKTGSQIDKASRLEVGSTIVKRYEDELKAKEEAKAEKSKQTDSEK